MPGLRVYLLNLLGFALVLVAAPNRRRVAELIGGFSAYDLAKYGRQVTAARCPAELRFALDRPGVVFIFGPDGEWVERTEKRRALT